MVKGCPSKRLFAIDPAPRFQAINISEGQRVALRCDALKLITNSYRSTGRGIIKNIPGIRFPGAYTSIGISFSKRLDVGSGVYELPVLYSVDLRYEPGYPG
jgi:hypothetical protein